MGIKMERQRDYKVILFWQIVNSVGGSRLARFLLLHKLNIGEKRIETDSAFFGPAGEFYV